MFSELQKINNKPKPFEFYTAEELWTNKHTARKMLEYHLNESVDAASRNRNFIDRSALWIKEHFNLNSSSKVIDFGCGPGLYTMRLAQSGAAITGIDFSKTSLEYAKEEARKNRLQINYTHTNYLQFNSEERFDLIIMIMCDFTALSPIQRKRLLKIFSSMLKPTGLILLDVYSMHYFNNKKEEAVYEFNQMDRFWSPDDYYSFLNIFKYGKEHLLLDKYTIFSKKEKREIYNWAQCYSEETITEEFEKNGFHIKEFFANVSGESFSGETDEFAVVAEKT